MSTVELGDDLGIGEGHRCKNRPPPLGAEAGELTREASRVGRIHAASVQVLGAFGRARRGAGLGTGFHGCTATFRDAARLLGVTQALGLDVPHDNLKSVENAA